MVAGSSTPPVKTDDKAADAKKAAEEKLAAKAKKEKAKNQTPAQRLEEMLQFSSEGAPIDPKVPQAAKEMPGIAEDYFQGKEAVLVKYIDAAVKAQEAQLQSDTPPSRQQAKAVATAEKAAMIALNDVKAVMENSPLAQKSEDGKKVQPAAEIKAITAFAKAYAAPVAAQAHAERLNEVTTELKKYKSKGWIIATIPDMITEVAKATTPEDKAKQVQRLQAKIHKLYPDLTTNDLRAVVEGIVKEASNLAKKIENANPVTNMATNALDSARKAATNLPAQIAKDAIVQAATGLPPGSKIALDAARKATGLG